MVQTVVKASRCHAVKVDPNVRKGETDVVASCLGLISLFHLSKVSSVLFPFLSLQRELRRFLPPSFMLVM